MKVRTRVAPSPTGDPHVGTAYMALFNYCFAKQYNGEFILRIEDTDQNRSTFESEQKIFDSLKWLGLNWTEGPDIGGKFAPYRQSERKHIYPKYAEQLVSENKAFKCFCSSHDLDEMRKAQELKGETQRYDGRCQHLTETEIESNISNNLPFVIRMKVPEEGTCIVNDLLRGEISFPWKQIDMQILLKQDGMPTYFLANVVDDYLMEITHVIRGEEWLPSTPKTILLYDYFGWGKPVFCHMPLLRDINGGKLSKRTNPTSITFYKDKGYQPEALVNYLGRMGWSMPNQEEKFSIDEMINNFDISRVRLGGPVFDIEKLSWLNGLWIREQSDLDFKVNLVNWINSNDKIEKLLPMVKSRVETYDKAIDIIYFIFNSDITYNLELFLDNGFDKEKTISIVKEMLMNLDNLRTWTKDSILDCLKKSANNQEVKFKQIMPLVFLIITGKRNSISVIDSMEIIGADLSRYRFRKSLEYLNSTS